MIKTSQLPATLPGDTTLLDYSGTHIHMHKTRLTDGTDTPIWTNFPITHRKNSRLWAITHSPPTLRFELCIDGGRDDNDTMTYIACYHHHHTHTDTHTEGGGTKIVKSKSTMHIQRQCHLTRSRIFSRVPKSQNVLIDVAHALKWHYLPIMRSRYTP